MIYLALSVLISSSLFVIFKLFDKYKVNTFQAIVINYLAAFCCGFFFYGDGITITEITRRPWMTGAVALGFLFIAVFILMALTAQRNGLSVASVASKMSVVIPVIFAVIVYQEKVSLLKIIGIILALLAVYLTTVKNDGSNSFDRKKLLFPILVFLGSGIIDTAIKYVETRHLVDGEVPIFSAAIFGCACLVGIVVAIIRRDVKISRKTIIGGIALGIPNFYSIIFLLKALRPENLGDSSTVFPINNVAIVMLSTIFGIIIFKEKLIAKNWIGIAIAIISIAMIAVSA